MIRVAATIALTLLLGSATARGDDGKLARDAARVAFNQGRFVEALEGYRRSYQLSPNADLFFNIGLCQESLHRNADAIASYNRFLELRPNVKDRGDVEVRIAALRLTMPAKPEAAAKPAPGRVAAAPPATGAPAVAASPPSLALGSAPVLEASAATVVAVAPPPPIPFYRRWWFWAGAAAVVVLVTTIAVGVGLASRSPFTFDGVAAQ